MKHLLIPFLTTAAALTPILPPSALHAGTVPTPMDPPQPSASASDQDWKITVWSYGWLAGLEGTTGINGLTTEVDIPFSGILDHLDMTASLNVEAQKGRWGGWVDGMYLKVSAGGNTPDPLLSSASLSVEQLLVEAALFYRVWEGQNGSLDLYGGARYMSVKQELPLSLSDSGVTRVSEELSSRVMDEITRRVKSRAPEILAEKQAQLASQIATQAGQVLDNVQAVGENHPVLAAAIKRSERLQQAIRDAATAQIQEKVATAQGVAAQVQAAARKAAARAEKALSKEIENALRETIPTSLSDSKGWVDPFVGVRGCYNFTDRFYVVGKADVGGFGVSSDLAWQVYGALGCHLSRRAVLELGYKHMSVDYTSGGFTNDVRTSGVLLNLGLKL
ncbi:hypothetical protein [Verrucomicrobium sp. BvORR106]|uniref:hypothetical protein n=1 Tax=Verrucomicrobium sp. BvORR106 TaxID=1403819 RepID=UPI00056F06A3|nr:hypothetical protein [Verrucomicrobium sp. BvORR106]